MRQERGEGGADRAGPIPLLLPLRVRLRPPPPSQALPRALGLLLGSRSPSPSHPPIHLLPAVVKAAGMTMTTPGLAMAGRAGLLLSVILGPRGTGIRGPCGIPGLMTEPHG